MKWDRLTLSVMFAALSGLLSGACNHNPLTGSSEIAPGLPWSPYIGIHTTGEAVRGYDAALEQMVAAGVLQGARVGVDPTGQYYPFTMRFASHGLEITGVLDNRYLFDNNIEKTMDAVLDRYYPTVTVYQLGNELSTIIPKTEPQLLNEAYMDRLLRAYRHIKDDDRYADVKLMTYSTFGAGTRGGQDLNELVRLGLREIPPDRLIIGVNVYTEAALVGLTSVRNRYLRQYRVWVMETGTNDPNMQIAFVNDFYPRLRRELGAEKIFWYVLWGGDVPPDTGFSLITRPQTEAFSPSPLFTRLVGGAQ